MVQHSHTADNMLARPLWLRHPNYCNYCTALLLSSLLSRRLLVVLLVLLVRLVRLRLLVLLVPSYVMASAYTHGSAASEASSALPAFSWKGHVWGPRWGCTWGP